jgi:Na+/melibiose symporter-like transporter
MNHNILRVSSDDKNFKSASNSNFYVTYGNNCCTEGVTKIILKTCQIPNVFYNINSSGYNEANTGNNVLQIEPQGGAIITIPFAPGNYTIDEIISALNSNAALVALGFVASFNTISNKFTATSTTAIKYLVNDTSTMSKYLGITSTTGFVTSFTAQSFPNLAGVKEVYLYSQKISDASNLIISESKNSPTIAVIPITVNFGSVNTFESFTAQLEEIVYPNEQSGKSLREIDLILKDKYGNNLSIGDLPFVAIFKIYHNLNN